MIYFDCAATSFQKPTTVTAAMEHALYTMTSPGRGGYESAVQAAETVYACREEAAQLFGLQDPSRVVFTFNATHALNIAIKSLVPHGGSVVISGYEHNAVTRPLCKLKAKIYTAHSPLFHPEESLFSFDAQIRPEICAVICNLVSNVFGFIQPIEEIAAICKNRNIPLIIDASQGAGVIPLNMDQLGASFIAAPGHKGLYGPQGTGILLCGEDIMPESILEGGTGSISLQQSMPEFLPDRLEAGTPNIIGIAGLLEGIRYVHQKGLLKIYKKERSLAAIAAAGLREFPTVDVFSSPELQDQTGVLSFRVKGRDCEEIASILGDLGFAVRAGLHCAPLAHFSGGTLESGTVRLSFSDFNTEEEVKEFLDAMCRVLMG